MNDLAAADYHSFESEPFPDPGDDVDVSRPEWIDEQPPDRDQPGIEPQAFDIDDHGRREALINLTDGTRVQLIQEIFVDWKSGTSVDLVVKGWLNRRTSDGRPPSKAVRLNLAHVIAFATRKTGRTVPPVDLMPMSNGSSGFFVVDANLRYGRYQSESFGAAANSLTLHYMGAWMVRAIGEPADNPIDSVTTQLLTTFSNGPRATSPYMARRGGA